MRLALVLFAICISFKVDANPNLIGTWCETQDFTKVLIIEETMDVEIFYFGNQEHVIHGRMQGYISLGASHQFLSVQGVEHELYDLRVSGHMKNRLTLEYMEGDTERYKKCKVVRVSPN